jgi:RNA polymerase sigma factor (sigma-70 family)
MDPLLEQFRVTRDPAAFRRIVDVHIDAIYSQCVRQLQDKHLAEDVTQAVFFMLAHKAGTLPSGTVLGGWLFTAARYACLHARRGELRRRLHEQEAANMRSEILDDENQAQRDEIERSLNDAVARLDRRDRDAVVLRSSNNCRWSRWASDWAFRR